MLAAELSELLRIAGPFAPFVVVLLIFRRNIQVTIRFDGRAQDPKAKR